MKIGLISFHAFYEEGGVKTHILNLQKEFKKRGLECKIIVPRRKRTENYGPDTLLLGTSFPVTFLGTQGDFCLSFNPLSIKKALKKERFDVLHFHNIGLPFSWQILRESNALNILTFHASLDGSNLIKNFPQILYPLKRVARRFDGIIGVSSVAMKHFAGFPEPQKIIPNGIHLNQFNPNNLKINKFLDGKINLLFVNRIEERKGLIYLLKAFKILNKKFSNLRLIVVGDGVLRKKCEKYVKENNLKEVCFEGAKKVEQVPAYYVSSDIFVAPSIFGETFGIVLLEAMASKVSVVAFANHGYKELLKNKKGGVLVPPKDYKGLAKELEVLIRDKSLRKRMGETGLKEAQEYSWDKIANRVLDFYQLCAKKKKG